MGKSLVIVESPAKAKTINKYLGSRYTVKSSVGHVRDLPTSGSGQTSDPKERAKKAQATRKLSPEAKAKYKKEQAYEGLIKRMGIDPERGWKPVYQILPGKEKVVNELKRLAKDADTIYLATDRDREGEAIAWHLREVIGGDESRFKRVVFNEITKSAISAAFDDPGDLDMSRVEAQQARRFLDRVVGFMVSPLLWAKVARGLSAGRVQSVAVRLVVEREREIRAFIPEEFWELHADTVNGADAALRLQVSKFNDKTFKPTSKEEMDTHLAALESADFNVASRDDKPTKTNAKPPFITSTMQQAASTYLGFGVKKTMMLAQRLYEAGYITYMRTDSLNLSNDAIEQVRGYLKDKFGKKYVPEEPNRYSNKKAAQEAHEAIRPTEVTLKGSDLSGVDRDAQRLSELIWRRFVSCQMLPARFTSSTISVQAGDYLLRTKGRVMEFDGYQKVWGQAEDDVQLPDVKVGDALTLKKLDPSQHFTKPPPRFSEAALVKELEKRGIGRPSTYAAIISTIQDRGYVRLEKKRFYAEKMGDIVTDRLVESFTDLMDYGFTANLEEDLDRVAHREKKWTDVLNGFYEDFKIKLERAGEGDAGMRPNEPTTIDIPCKTCERPMQIRTASTGVFLGCSGYGLPPKERCKSTMNLVPGEEAVDVEANESAEVDALMARRRCPLCGTAMESYLVDEKRKLHVCGNNPDCNGYEVEQGTFKIKGYDGPVIECDKCGSEMQLKTGRFGKYFGCTNDTCKNTRKLLKNGEAAPPKEDPVPMPHLKCEKHDDFYLLRDGAAGIFLAASQFPKHRETRAPLVSELAEIKDQVPEKYRYLADAPVADPEGNPAMVRFSRKTKEQYVMSEVEGKASGWKAHFRNAKWEEEGEVKSSARKAKGSSKKGAGKKSKKSDTKA